MKRIFAISAPVDTYSGYGARSRDLVKAVVETGQFEVFVIPQRWGNTSPGFIQNHKEEWGFLTNLMTTQLPFKPDIWMQITVPNEFQPVGEYNIGVTAGIETTVCDSSWIEGINRMDLTLVSSEFSKQVLLNTSYSVHNKEGVDTGEVLKVTKPLEVLMEGVTDVYSYISPENYQTPEGELQKLDQIPEDFLFLTVGHWMQGDVGQDRKNIGLTIQLFLEAFKDTESPPGLLLKTMKVNGSTVDARWIKQTISQIQKTVKARKLPNIYLLHGELTDRQINSIYNHPKVKSLVSLTKGEGFGRPLLEFTMSKKPVIASKWSGHLDFLTESTAVLIGGTVEKIHPSAVVPNMLLPESGWFSVNPQETWETLREVHKNYNKYLSKAKAQFHHTKKHFTFEDMKVALEGYLEKYVPNNVIDPWDSINPMY